MWIAESIKHISKVLIKFLEKENWEKYVFIILIFFTFVFFKF